MKTLFWRTLKDKKLTLLIYTVIAALLVIVYVGLYPSFQDKMKELEKVAEAYPEELLKAFGMEEGLNFSKLENYLATEQYSFTWPILVVALMISWGGAAIAGEIEKGTVELLLAQPISRLKIFIGKYLSGLAGLAIFTLVSVFVAIPSAMMYGIDYQAANYVMVAVAGFLFGWTVLSLAFLFSALFSDKGKAYFLSAGVVVISYVINIIANIKDNLGDLGYLSFFHYFDANAALIRNEIDSLTYLVLIGTAVVFAVLAAWRFVRRDITT